MDAAFSALLESVTEAVPAATVPLNAFAPPVANLASLIPNLAPHDPDLSAQAASPAPLVPDLVSTTTEYGVATLPEATPEQPTNTEDTSPSPPVVIPTPAPANDFAQPVETSVAANTGTAANPQIATEIPAAPVPPPATRASDTTTDVSTTTVNDQSSAPVNPTAPKTATVQPGPTATPDGTLIDAAPAAHPSTAAAPVIATQQDTAAKPGGAEPETETEATENEPSTDRNPVPDVLAGFLMAQIEPAVLPANDLAPDGPAIGPAPPSIDESQPAPVQPAAVEIQAAVVATTNVATPKKGDPIAPVTFQSAKANPAPATPDAALGDGAQQASGNETAMPQPAAAEHDGTMDLVAAHEKALAARSAEPDAAAVPEAKTGTHAEPTSDVRSTTAAEPSPAAPTTTAAGTGPHHPPAASAVANPVAPEVSGLRKLGAGLQIAAQQQDATATLDKLGLSIATKSVEGLRQFDIRLDPPELGRVDVRLTMDDTGRAQATLVIDKPQTLELLQRDAPALNRALGEAGLDLSNNGLNFSLREQNRQSDGSEDQGRGRSLSAKAVVQTDATPIHSSLGSYAPNSARLDIRV